LITVGTVGSAQTIYVQTPSGDWQNSVENPEHFSVSGELFNGTRTIYTADSLAPGAYTFNI
jgi:hypothetical protein